jgi:hypothetical protein
MFPVMYEHHLHMIKQSCLPLAGCADLEGCEILMIPRCVDSRLTDVG